MIYHYLVQYCTPPTSVSEKAAFYYKYPRALYTGKKLIRMEGIDHGLIEEVAKATEGFSGREIMKMVVAWHDAAFTLPDATLTPDVVRNVLHKFELQHKLKDTWTSDESAIFGKLVGHDNDEALVGSNKNQERDADMLERQE